MERINPPMIPVQMLKLGELCQVDSLSEIGIYSSIFTKNVQGKDGPASEIIENRTYGTLLRTKGSHFNEGGVCSGYAVVDHPYIVPEKVLTEKAKDLPFGNLMGTVSAKD
jgi:hypothetical protein